MEHLEVGIAVTAALPRSNAASTCSGCAAERAPNAAPNGSPAA